MDAIDDSVEPDAIDYLAVSNGPGATDEAVVAARYRLAQARKLIRMAKAYDIASPRVRRLFAALSQTSAGENSPAPAALSHVCQGRLRSKGLASPPGSEKSRPQVAIARAALCATDRPPEDQRKRDNPPHQLLNA